MTPSLEAAVQRLIADRERQGLPSTVADPAALAAIATIVRPALGRPATKRRQRPAA